MYLQQEIYRSSGMRQLSQRTKKYIFESKTAAVTINKAFTTLIKCICTINNKFQREKFLVSKQIFQWSGRQDDFTWGHSLIDSIRGVNYRTFQIQICKCSGNELQFTLWFRIAQINKYFKSNYN